MHAKALEIAWHDNSAIWSVDISCSNRVVTASGDKVARIWRFHSDPFKVLSSYFAPSTTPTSSSLAAPVTNDTNANNSPKPPPPTTTARHQPKLSKLTSIKLDASLVEWLCDLRAHATTINIARFAPNGRCVATAADLGEIVLWRLENTDGRPIEKSPMIPEDEQPKERWQRDATLRGHVQDVLDLAWSADGRRIASASVDNTVMLWDVAAMRANSTNRPPPVVLRNHSNFVQGVAIDPFNRLIASMGNDRALRIFTSNTNANSWLQVSSTSCLPNLQEARLFVDDSKFKNFFRRLDWSPDGSVLACPSGIDLHDLNDSSKSSPSDKENANNINTSTANPNNNNTTPRKFAVHIFSRNLWITPVIQCGGLPSPACAVRFNPILFQLRGTDVKTPGPFAAFTYRMIFAVACVHSILFYDTESLTRPFATVEGLHCAEQTDLSWSADGRTCLVSSVDGYISTICFSPDELGPILPRDRIPSWLQCQEPSDLVHSLGKSKSTLPSTQQNVNIVTKTVEVAPVSMKTTVVTPVKKANPSIPAATAHPIASETKIVTTHLPPPASVDHSQVANSATTPAELKQEASIQPAPVHDVPPTLTAKKRGIEECIGDQPPSTPKKDDPAVDKDLPPDTMITTTPQGYRITPPGPNDETEDSVEQVAPTDTGVKSTSGQPSKKLKLGSTPSKRKAKTNLVQTKFFIPKPKAAKDVPNVALVRPAADRGVKTTGSAHEKTATPVTTPPKSTTNLDSSTPSNSTGTPAASQDVSTGEGINTQCTNVANANVVLGSN